MIRRLFFVLSIGLNLSSLAQEPNVIRDLKSKLVKNSSADDRLMTFNDLAWEYYSTNFDSAIYYVEKALALAIAEESAYWQAVSMEMKAILMEVSGNLSQAIKLYLEVIPIREKLGGVGLETTFNNMAIIFRVQGDHEKALDYFTKSYELELKNENTSGMAGSLNNMALCYEQLQIADSVPVLLKKSLKLADKAGDERMAMHSLVNLGDWYHQNGKNDSARTYMQAALPLSQKLGDYSSGCVALMGLAKISTEEGSLELAQTSYSQALIVANKVNSLDYQGRAHRGLSGVYKGMGKDKLALDELEKYLALREKLLNEELVRSTNELEQKYQNAKSKEEIAQLQLAATRQNLEAEQNANQRQLLFLVALMLIIILGFVTYRFIYQRKTSRLLRSKNRTIAQSLSERELLLREIHHRVKNNLQIVSSLLSIQGREISDEKAKDAISESKNRVHSMALIHQFLYSDRELASIDMEEYIPELCRKLFNAYKLDHDLIDLKINVEPIHLDIDTAIPLGIILNELITNSLKYAFDSGDEGSITVSFAERQNQLVLNVKDTGHGKKDSKVSEISFGMKLIRAFEAKLDARIEILETKGFEVICAVNKYKRLWPKSTAS